MPRRPPAAPLTDTLIPCPTLARSSGGLVVPAAPYGMGCFDLGGNRVALVRNYELKPGAERKGAFAGGTVKGARVYAKCASGEPLPGGTTTIVYDMASGEVKSEHLSLAGTAINCAEIGRASCRERVCQYV